uniref:Uncharacterized protein n=1 Tax=Fagus sylvatica TaxID=28930 RepID=A0A2N9FJF4_FAGSY
MRGGRVGFIENRARLAQHHHARRMTVLRELWYCHVAVLSFHASSPSNPPRFPCAYPFLSDFRGQFWRSSGTQTGSCGISSESSRRPLSNDIKFARIGVRTRELWLPEVGVSELFSCTLPVRRFRSNGGCYSANREFHDVAGVIIFPTHPGSRINLLRAGKTLRAKAAVREKKCVLLPARFFSNLVPVPDSRESELGLVRYGPASRVHRGVFGPFEGSFPIRIPADPDKFLAIREFHVVHGCVLFPMCPGSQINLLRVRKTLCASAATSVGKFPEISAQPYFVGLFSRAWPCTEASLGSQDMILRTGGRRNVPYAKGSIQFLVWSTVRSNLGQTWSTLVKLGRIWSNSPNSLEMYPGLHFKGFWARRTLVGLETARSNLGQTSVNPSQTWSTLVKLGQTLGNVSRTFFLGVFDADEPSSDQTGLVRAVSFCAPTPEKIPGSLPDSQQVDLRARAHWKEDTSMHDVELSDRQEFIGRKLSDGTKNVKIRHRELGQICARTGTRFEKKRAGSKTHFFSRTAAFARRVFPARNKLIREPGCVGKIMTPATSWNSRFADSIPRLTGIFASEKCTKTAPTPRLPGAITPSSELRFAQTLYRWKEDVESFPTICRMTHFEFQKTSKTAPENRIKKGTRTEIEEDSRGCWRGRIRLPRGSTTTRAGPSCAAHDGAARGVHGFL